MSAAPFDFDEEIDRTRVPALKWRPLAGSGPEAELFPAGVADMDFRAAPCIRAAMRRRLDHGVFGYEAVPEGLFPALIDWHAKRHGWHIEPSHILRAPNVLDSLAIAASLFTAPGDGIILQPPVFFDFFDVIAENRREVLLNPLRLEGGRYEMDFEGLARLAARPRAKMLFLCNPHNPVGRVWSRAELARLDEICRRHGVLVVADEIHADIALPGHRFTPFAALGEAAAANAISCISPAKAFNIASCCSAFTIVADRARRRAFQAENSRLTVNKNNAFASVAMEAAWREGGPWLDAAIAYVAGNLALMRARLAEIPGVDLIEPEGTFLAWLDFRALGLAPGALAAFLRERAGWLVSRGEAFGSGGAGFARVNIACTRARLRRALDRLAAAMGGSGARRRPSSS